MYRNRRVWKATIVLTVGLVASVFLAVPGNAHNSTPASTSSTTETGKTIRDRVPPGVAEQMRAQQPYLDAAYQIMDAVESSEAQGFAGVALGDRAVDVWWKGVVPPSVQTTIDDVRRTVTVNVKAAPHSRQELSVQAAQLATAMKSDPASSLFAIQIPVDGSRLIAMYEKNTPATLVADGGTTLTTSHGPQAKSVSMRNSAGIPVEVVEDERIRPACGPPTRWNDGWTYSGCNFSTFSAGGAIYNTELSGRCTAGFGVKNSSGQRFLLTAGHCGRPNAASTFLNGISSRWIGYPTREHAAHDLLLIPTNSDSFMWDGPWNSNWGKTVTGWRYAVPNALVCQSGSSSGVQCGIRNSSNFTYRYCDIDPYGTYECYDDLVWATRNNGTPPVRDGDSGGPVFTLDLSNTVWATGIVSGGNSTAMVYQDFYTAVWDFGITTLNNN